MRSDRWRDGALLLTAGAFSAGYASPGMVGLLAVFAAEATSRRWRWVPTSLDLPLLGVIAAALASALASEWRGLAVGSVGLLILTALVSVRSTAAYAQGGPEQIPRLLGAWIAGGVGAALWGLARHQPVGSCPDSTALALRWCPASTPALGQNALGTTLAVATVLALGILATGLIRPRWVVAAALPILLAGLVATWTRGAWLATAAGLVTLAFVNPHPRARAAVAFALGTLIVFGIAAVPRWPALYDQVRSIASLTANRNRISLWGTVPKMVADHPVLGTGFGTFSLAYPRYRQPDSPDRNPPFAHNIFLNFAAETGLVGLVAFMVLCAAGLASMWRWTTRSPPASQARALAGTILAGTVTILVTQLVDGTVMSVHLGFGFYALLACGAAGSRYCAYEAERVRATDEVVMNLSPGPRSLHPPMAFPSSVLEKQENKRARTF